MVKQQYIIDGVYLRYDEEVGEPELFVIDALCNEINHIFISREMIHYIGKFLEWWGVG